MKPARLFRRFAALGTAALLLTACGGGGGGDEAPRFQPSAQLEGDVAGCALETQKSFVRSYLDEVYLWYSEIPQVDASAYGNIPDYFRALLVRTPDANGLPKDRFSDVLPTSQARATGSSAAAFDPRLASHTSYVPRTFTGTTGGGRSFGYIQFNDHDVGAQDDLIAAFRQLRDQTVQDLVLDLRFNSGGYLYIALAAASMVTGPASQGKVFEQLQYNAKRNEETAASALKFSSSVQFAESQNAVGTALPQLGLSRLFVLTSGATCSASESIINALRGIDVQVVLVGSTTCGKPYGFRRKDNCGWAYFPIEFQGTNAKGFGGYTTGFTPTCQVADDTSVAAGDAGDPLLTAAQHYIDNNACPAGTATGAQSAARALVHNELPRRPSWAGRLLLPEQR